MTRQKALWSAALVGLIGFNTLAFADRVEARHRGGRFGNGSCGSYGGWSRGTCGSYGGYGGVNRAYHGHFNGCGNRSARSNGHDNNDGDNHVSYYGSSDQEAGGDYRHDDGRHVDSDSEQLGTSLSSPSHQREGITERDHESHRERSDFSRDSRAADRPSSTEETSVRNGDSSEESNDESASSSPSDKETEEESDKDAEEDAAANKDTSRENNSDSTRNDDDRTSSEN